MDSLALTQVGDQSSKFAKVFRSSFNSPQQTEGEGLTSMYRIQKGSV